MSKISFYINNTFYAFIFNPNNLFCYLCKKLLITLQHQLKLTLHNELSQSCIAQ